MNLDIGLPVDKLRQPLRQCLSGESPFVRVELTATNRRGKTIALDVGCTPFALANNPTWGAILTMEEVQGGRPPA
jgi:two-component system CheB/CheR fusion protein